MFSMHGVVSDCFIQIVLRRNRFLRYGLSKNVNNICAEDVNGINLNEISESLFHDSLKIKDTAYKICIKLGCVPRFRYFRPNRLSSSIDFEIQF